MLFAPGLAAGGFNWLGLVVTLVVLAVVWLVVRTILKITLKIFAIGCLGLLILSGIAFVLFYAK
jgi:hypothetical protein